MAQNIMDSKLSKSEEQEIYDSLVRSRIQMLMHFPFFGILCLSLKLIQEYGVPTAATDGNSFFYNPNFIKSLSESERNWIVVHEVLHPALKHIWRKGERNHNLWNQACDYAIHDIMVQFTEGTSYNDRDKLKMPKGCLYSKEFKDMSAEQIYGELEKNPKMRLLGNGQNGEGDVIDDHSMWGSQGTQNNSQAKQVDWEGKLISAAKSAEGKCAGNVPGFLQRLIGKITKPQKDWRVLLAEFVQPTIDDYSFNPPDRRFQDSDFMLPDFNDTSESVENIEFWIDTSGSMQDREISVCYSELVGAINQFNGNLSGRLCFFDFHAYGPYEFEGIDDVLKIKPEGGGGTSFNVIFDDIGKRQTKDDIAGIVILTDGYASWPNEKAANGIPVLWIINNENQKPPWGLHTTINI